MESFYMNLLVMLAALSAVLALAWLTLRLLRRGLQARATPGGGPGNVIRFVRALSVGPKERVVIIEHDGRRWMLGVGSGAVNLIAELTPDNATAALPADDPSGVQPD